MATKQPIKPAPTTKVKTNAAVINGPRKPIKDDFPKLPKRI